MATEGGISKAKMAAYKAVLGKIEKGRSPTAADQKLIDEVERAARAEKARREGPTEEDEQNYGREPEEDLEEWTVRDGVVDKQVRTLPSLARRHQMERGEIEKLLWKVQRDLLRRYGFEGAKKTGALTGDERQALQWVISIEQLRRASQEWELQMQEVRHRRGQNQSITLEEFATLVQTVKQLAERRDSLVLKVRELGAKEKRAGTARGQKALSFVIGLEGEV
jgi:HD superfamily phosphohydrolase